MQGVARSQHARCCRRETCSVSGLFSARCMPAHVRGGARLLSVARAYRSPRSQSKRFMASVRSTQAPASTLPDAARLHWSGFDGPVLWESSAEEAMAPSSRLQSLRPGMRLMVMSDGSVTRHLALAFGRSVHVQRLHMDAVSPASAAGLPQECRLLQHPLLERQVLLHLPDHDGLGPAYVYATSWWNTDTANECLKDKQQPIWTSLSQKKTEIYREIQCVSCGHSAELERAFQSEGPFWARRYLFYRNGRPLTLIHEVFSNALEETSSAEVDPRMLKNSVLAPTDGDVTL